MAFPTATTTEGSVNTAGTSHAVTLPASGSATDLFLIIMSIGSTAATLNALTDWGELLDENAAVGLKILRYTGTGVPGDPTFTSSASTRSAWVAFKITGADKTVTPQIGTTATGTSTTPDPPAVTPTGGTAKDYLSIAFCGSGGEQADDDSYVTSFPTDYTLYQVEKTCGTAGTNLGGLIGTASREINTGSAIDPGTFTVSENAAWRAQHILVHPILPPVNTVAPAVTGTIEEGELLSCTQGTWSPAGDSYGYQWQRDTGSGFGNIGSATSSTYTLVTDDVGADVRCVVTATNGGGSVAANSNEVGPIELAWEDITSETADEYLIDAGDEDYELRCLVVATNAAGDSDPEPSNTLGPVESNTHTVDDTAAVTDTVARAAGKAAGDTASVTDGTAKTLAKALADTANVTDEATPSSTNALTHDIDDTAAVTDAQAKAATKTAADTAAVTDAQAKTAAHALADTAEVSDTVTAPVWEDITGETTSSYLIDEIDEDYELRCLVTATNSAGDSDPEPSNTLGPVTAAGGPTVHDTISGTDTIAKALSKAIADTAEVTDTGLAQASDYTHTVDDTLEVTDGIDTGGNTSHTQEPDDTAALTDTVAKALSKAIADTASATDEFARAAEYDRTIDEILALGESVNTGGSTAHTHSVNDSISAADATAKHAAHTQADTATAADARTGATGKALTETPAVTDTFTRDWEAFLALTETPTVTDAIDAGIPTLRWLTDPQDRWAASSAQDRWAGVP